MKSLTEKREKVTRPEVNLLSIIGCASNKLNSITYQYYIITNYNITNIIASLYHSFEYTGVKIVVVQ